MLSSILRLLDKIFGRIFRIRWNVWVLLLILGLLGTSIWMLTPSGSSSLDREKENLGMRLGLDLAGGTHLVYQVDFDEDWDSAERAFHMDRAITTIRNRIDKYGVAEPIIQKQGDDRILVQLPGITDRDEARALIEQTGFLEFREVELNGTSVVRLEDYTSTNRSTYYDTSVAGSRYFYIESTDSPLDPVAILTIEDSVPTYTDLNGTVITDTTTLDGSAICWMPATGTLKVDDEERQVQLIGGYLSNAEPRITQNPPYESSVSIDFNSDGVTLFNDIAKRLYISSSSQGGLRNQLGIILDGQLISSPVMHIQNANDGASITGNFTWDEARLLAIQLDSGALPMPLEKPPLYERTVSATLGADFIDRAVLAGVIGLGVVILFMILYYRLSGVLASLSLLVYVAIVLAIFKMIPVTLTLAGLAGFILSIGMAVDANVLIFERMKEELRGGRTVKAAVETGFNRAWTAIRDSNISTFIICGILYWFGSSIADSPAVKGFAVTLAIGVAVSMFSAIIITRTFLRFSTGARAARNPKWYGVKASDV